MEIAIIGAGINGLVAANYLRRYGHAVTILERKPKTGGACCSATFLDYTYPQGASVFGLMPEFLMKEIGLNIHTFIPPEPDLYHFPHHEKCFYYEDVDRLTTEEGQGKGSTGEGNLLNCISIIRNKWNEKGDIKGFHRDLNDSINIFRKTIRQGRVISENDIPEHLLKWFVGSAKDLLKHYFTSEITSLAHSISVIESGPVPLHSPCSAFNIVLMSSGQKWGFPKNGIWEIAEQLTQININLGVQIKTGVCVQEVDDYDVVVFATDPKTAAKIAGVELEEKHYLGLSGKQVLFFKKPIIWKDGNGFQFIFEHLTLDSLENSSNLVKNQECNFSPTFFEIYPEGTNRRRAGWQGNYDYCSVFFKDVRNNESNVKTYVQSLILDRIDNPEDYVDSVLLSSGDLREVFFFPEGNIDHMELCAGQTLWHRTFSKNSKRFYQFGENERHFYCGAGAYPCGSVSGLAGYLCAEEILEVGND